MVPELNDIYSGIQYTNWRQKIIEPIISLKQDYLHCILKLLQLNFPFPLLTSFCENTKKFNNNWKKENNYFLYQELKKLGVKI